MLETCYGAIEIRPSVIHDPRQFQSLVRLRRLGHLVDQDNHPICLCQSRPVVVRERGSQ